jgi:hypothetical protein
MTGSSSGVFPQSPPVSEGIGYMSLLFSQILPESLAQEGPEYLFPIRLSVEFMTPGHVHSSSFYSLIPYCIPVRITSSATLLAVYRE